MPNSRPQTGPVKLGWSVKSSRVAYSGRFPVIEDVLVADLDGRETLYTYLDLRGQAVSVLALNDRGEVLVTREYRHPLGGVLRDLPTGTVKRGESPRDAALRELREEAGYQARQALHFGTVHPVPALAAIAFEYFLATGLELVGARPDAMEILAVEWVPFPDLLNGVVEGVYRHGALPFGVILAAQKGLIPVQWRELRD